MMKMVIYYEHNALWLSQDAKVYQVDTTKHRGTNVCLPHTLTVKTHIASSQFSQWLSNTERWQLDSNKDSLGLAQFINKYVAEYEYVNLISSEWQKFCGGDPKAVSSETQSQLFVE